MVSCRRQVANYDMLVFTNKSITNRVRMVKYLIKAIPTSRGLTSSQDQPSDWANPRADLWSLHLGQTQPSGCSTLKISVLVLEPVHKTIISLHGIECVGFGNGAIAIYQR